MGNKINARIGVWELTDALQILQGPKERSFTTFQSCENT